MNKAELRRLAEAANKAEIEYTDAKSKGLTITPHYFDTLRNILDDFDSAANPSAIIELLSLIEAMQCCGNCRNSAINFSGGSKMLCKMRTMGAMDNYAIEKCEKWQGVE